MRHPFDGSSWKEFDKKYPNFSREPRNVRLRLATDGFNPFGNMSLGHSTWSVVLTTYNLPPWLCMKESSFMLTLLIPGPKSPGKDMDIFLKPLVDELKPLWQEGLHTKDAMTNTFFTMKAALLWAINDFPACSSLSGWSGQGYNACPTCNEDTSSVYASNKVVYLGHRRFLDANHRWRTSLGFNGEPETKAPPPPPKQFSLADIEDQLGRLLHRLPGKHPDFGGPKRKREEFELNWTKRSIFFELEYWSTLQLKHNLDVMHIERNMCDSLLGTLIMNDKTKDTSNARDYLKTLNIRRTQWLQEKGNKRVFGQRYFYTNSRPLHILKATLLPNTIGGGYEESQRCHYFNIVQVRVDLSFNIFEIMVRLVLHLPDEAIRGGSIYMRWVYPFERYMKKLKKFVSNKVYMMKIQSSPNFHPDLYALSIGEDKNAFTYTACIVNGDRFMVLGRDAKRITQISGVLAEEENGEKFYGQVEEIIELCYPNGYSTVLFQCKLFDTRRGVTFNNNITSINTEREWDKEDKLIFASQVKQVFYIQGPSGANQSKKTILFVMADIMPRGHGGDGAEDPPPPGGFRRGCQEEDVVLARKGRGTAKNIKVLHAFAKNGRKPLRLTFDRFATFSPIGDVGDMFIRDVGNYMWRNIVFDKDSWASVSEEEKNALNEHMRIRDL
ncbi:uncharacterized protein LOC143595759 [Bidens hawaiensis]|uniref:uncharacterized protein LOC143595759 n=1 Tax=Bidens hawaiensis TaxID=980011 RepID=UPI004049AC2C